jgi:hypothetical protein
MAGEIQLKGFTLKPFIKTLGITFLFCLLISPVDLFAQNSQLRFFVYGNCGLTSEEESGDEVVNELFPEWKNPKNFKYQRDVPSAYAKTHIKPLAGEIAYVFSGSSYVGSTKVKKIYFSYGEIDGWSIVYQKDMANLQKSPEIDSETLRNAIDVFCDLPVDVKKLKELNAQNGLFVSQNGLTDEQSQSLLKEIAASLKNIDQPTTQPINEMKITKNRNIEVKRAASDWKPDDLYLGQLDNSQIKFSIQFPETKITVAIIESPSQSGTSPFILCKTSRGLFFYPSMGLTSFDQIINWFGHDYISFSWAGDGGYGKTIYHIAEDGLEKVGTGGVATD